MGCLSAGTTVNGEGKNFGHHFFSTVHGGVDGKTSVQPISSGTNSDGWGYLDFDPTDPETDSLVLRVATSMISAAQAEFNHAAEVHTQLID